MSIIQFHIYLFIYLFIKRNSDHTLHVDKASIKRWQQIDPGGLGRPRAHRDPPHYTEKRNKSSTEREKKDDRNR